VLATKTKAKEMLMRLKFEICLLTVAECFIYGLDYLDETQVC